MAVGMNEQQLADVITEERNKEMTVIIDAAAVFEDIALAAARADLEAEVDKVIALAVDCLPSGVNFEVDRESIVAAVQGALA